MTEQICVCCGGPVRVVSGEDGSNSYESLAAERLRAVETERDRLLVLFAIGKSNDIIRPPVWERALSLVEIRGADWGLQYDQLIDTAVSRGLALALEGEA